MCENSALKKKFEGDCQCKFIVFKNKIVKQWFYAVLIRIHQIADNFTFTFLDLRFTWLGHYLSPLSVVRLYSPLFQSVKNCSLFWAPGLPEGVLCNYPCPSVRGPSINIAENALTIFAPFLGHFWCFLSISQKRLLGFWRNFGVNAFYGIKLSRSVAKIFTFKVSVLLTLYRKMRGQKVPKSNFKVA